jgi:hypothetical protein
MEYQIEEYTTVNGKSPYAEWFDNLKGYHWTRQAGGADRSGGAW